MSVDDKLPKTGQGNAQLADSEDLKRDELGYTNPNLHRRVMSPGMSDEDKSILDTQYKLGIYGNDSYRTVETITHDESDFSNNEIP